MSGSKKTTQSQSQQQTATTQLPAWMTAAGQGLYQDAAATAKANPITAYTGERVAGLSGNQEAAGAAAASGAGAWKPALGTAGALTMGAATAGPASVQAGTFGAREAARYEDPYRQQVQADTLATMRDQGEMDRQALGDQAQASRAFGGARHAILEAEQAKNQERARTEYVNQSNQAGFESGRDQFNRDADRSLQSETTNAGLWEQMLGRMMGGGAQVGQLADTGSGLNARDVAVLGQTGAVAQDTAQAGRDAEYQEFLRMQDAPMERYRDLMAILSGTPRDVTTTGSMSGSSTTKQKGSFMDTLMGLGQLGLSAASTFSDPRLKKDVGLIERLASGLGIYRYRYLWQRADEPEHIGVMADEVERIAPQALGPIVLGFRTVDYSKLGALA